MAYFPFYIDIKYKNCLIVGGGKVALRKIEKLLPFEPKIKVVAPKICDEILNMGNVEIYRRKFEDRDLDGVFMAISATDDRQVNAHLFQLCKSRNILINTVDDKEKCGFIFPAIVKKKDITFSITTSGESPILAKYLKEQADDILDERTLKTARVLSQYRQTVKDMFDSEKQRKKVFEVLLERCMNDDILPDHSKINLILKEIKNSYENQNRNEKKSSCHGTDENGM